MMSASNVFQSSVVNVITSDGHGVEVYKLQNKTTLSYKKDASKFQNEHPVLKETDVGEVAYKAI